MGFEGLSASGTRLIFNLWLAMVLIIFECETFVVFALIGQSGNISVVLLLSLDSNSPF